jgi:hypothetical protein
MAKIVSKAVSPDDVIASIFSFLPSKFSNNPKIIHKKLFELKQNKDYNNLLADFEFINHYDYPYSPLLSRVLNRLQETRLLSSLNPSYDIYEMDRASKKAIKQGILNTKLKNEHDKLKEMAGELEKSLRP